MIMQNSRLEAPESEGKWREECSDDAEILIQDSLTAAVTRMAVLISLGRRGPRHRVDRALILERTNFRTVSGTDGVRVEEIEASPGGRADAAATSAALIITTITTAIIIVFSLVTIGE